MIWPIYIIMSAILGSFGFITRKKALVHEHAMEFGFFRSLINLILLLFLMFFIDIKINSIYILFLAIAAFLVSLGVVYRNKAVRHDNVSSIAPLGGLSNIAVLLLGIVFLKEIPEFIHLIGIFVCFIGIYILEMDKKQIFCPIVKIWKKKSVHFFIFAIFMFSIATVIIRSVVIEISPFTTMFYMWFFISLFLIMFEVMLHGVKDFKDFKKEKNYIIITTVLMFFGNLLFYVGLSFPEAKAVLGHTLRTSGILFTTFFGGRIFHEKNLLRKSAASLIILIGAILVII